MEFRKQCHGEVDHFQTFGDDNRFPFETCKPVTIRCVIALNSFGLTFAHEESSLRDNGTVNLIFIGAIDLYVPLF